MKIYNCHVISPKPTGFNVTLRHYKSEQHGGCGKQQEPSVLLSHSLPTLLACLEELRSLIKGDCAKDEAVQQKHCGDCAKSADEAAQAFGFVHKTSRAAEGLFKCAPSVPDEMMRLRDATLCAAAASKVALEAEQRKIAAEKEVQDLKRELGCKRPQADASTIDANVEMQSEVGDLDLADHCGHTKQWWNQSQVELSSLEEVPPSRTGKDWYVHHPRLGPSSKGTKLLFQVIKAITNE